LASEEGETDAWATAAKYASEMLPGIFRPDDPAAQLRLAPEGRNALETILNSFPAAVFTADDSLGWIYQFWQKNKKDEINASERKIGGSDIAPVTQLFTEDYMVRFLLENSLGAWWAGKHPNSPLIKKWEYLRFKEDGTPAAGTFPGWPQKAAEVTLMDPCCGSGHFLVAGFDMQVEMRMEEEGLSEVEAAEAVLRDNIFGLEIDPRCTQIAAFALALAAWKRGGYRSLPLPNVACSGIPVQGQLETWLKLAGKEARLRAALERLYQLFGDAPDLGSLINPADLPQDEMFMASYEEVAPVFEQALKKEHASDDQVVEIFGSAAEGVARAGQLLARKYTLVITNVPYLGSGKQGEVLRNFCSLKYPDSKSDLATAFVERCLEFCQKDGRTAAVTPQYWLFLNSYKKLRINLIKSYQWDWVIKLGTCAFSAISGEIVNVALVQIAGRSPSTNSEFFGIDLNREKTIIKKELGLRTNELINVNQLGSLDNPEARIILSHSVPMERLNNYVRGLEGLSTGDSLRYIRMFWELPSINREWSYLQGGVSKTRPYGGCEQIVFWENGKGLLVKDRQARIQGDAAWGKEGIIVCRMNSVRTSIYLGGLFDKSCVVLIPKKPDYLSTIWQYCANDQFEKDIRLLDAKLSVATATITQVPFDLEYWQKAAEASGPLPEPHSDDPTQWLFNGRPVGSLAPLQVEVACLLGYHWPQQSMNNLDSLADEDGIVCLPPVNREVALVERLRGLLVQSYGEAWVPERTEAKLLAAGSAPGKSLDEWLRDDFFPQHCRLFQNRPFVWHIWDGRKDGFSALVNYHKLDSARLDKLIFTYLGDWIRFQRARRDHGEPGADGRLVAALELEKKLKLIKEGEPPYDIYIRWKPLSQQPLGWNPDLNDGVRLNIRPFITAGVLRSRFTINWNKDRGKNLDGSERKNDLHYTLAEKRSAREAS
jgi:hypothetical protein